MDIISTTQRYVNEMIRLAGPGMKVILMDKEMTSVISCAYAQSELMQKEVYLFERIDAGTQREPIKYLKCVVFLRPTPENVQLLSEELRWPCYAQYYINFSNIISKADIKTLAESDEQETVREVREFYADVIPLAPHLCSIGVARCYETPFNLSTTVFRRCVQALLSVLLSTRKRPVIRYQRNSRDAHRMADELQKIMQREDVLFDGCKTGDSVLIVVERSEDPVSPLLNQWTYEAMVHELLGLHNNRVQPTGAAETTPSIDALKNLILNPAYDEFYAKNMYLNFGDIGQNIKTLMNDYQTKAQTHQQLESISDMKRFVEQYPQFKKISGTVAKHVQLMGELSRLVTTHNLLEVSELEQSIVSGGGSFEQCFESMKRLVGDTRTTELDALRLAMLFALRFETHGSFNLRTLMETLKHKCPVQSINAVRLILDYAGQRRRQHDVFGNRSAMEMTKRFIKGLKGVENIYTQHEPHINQLVDQVMRGRLPDTLFLSTDQSQYSTRFENVIIFIIGGATYEEAAYVAAMNRRCNTSIAPGSVAGSGTTGGVSHPSVLLCSNYVHNTRSFVQQLAHFSATSQMI